MKWTAAACLAALVVGGAIAAADKLGAQGAVGPDEATAANDAPQPVADLPPDMIYVAGNIIQKRNVSLIPVMRASQNLHDCVKQLCLIEAHLFDSERACTDCLVKHFCTIQALLEEALSLVENGDKSLPVPTDIQGIEQQVRSLHIEWFDSDRGPAVRHKIACQLRQIRKSLMPAYGRPMVA